MFIGLNPSTANEKNNDNTITKVIKIAKNNGFGGVYMMNCWAYVSTDPKQLVYNQNSNNRNNDTLVDIASMCSEIVFAWGNFSIVKELSRDKELCEMFPNAKALHINKNGSPKHPLYCKDDTILIPFNQ